MNETHINGRLAWLNGVLASQRNNLGKILLRLKGIGVRAGTSLKLHRKFMHLMEQVATERDKEMDILHEIECVEKRHLALKQSQRLRCATDEKTALPAQASDLTAPEEEPKRMSLLTLFGLLYLFGAKPIKHKNQDLTVD